MIKNYLKIAFRNLVRDRAFSILNIAGLAIGLASVIIIMAYIRYELSYDKSYSNHARVYRLVQETKTGSKDEFSINTSMGMGPVLQKEFPAVNGSTEAGVGDAEFKYHDEIISLHTIFVSADFFKIFNFPFLSGNSNSALSGPGSIVITEAIAKRLFAGKNPVGAVITDNNGRIKHITGVIKDIPANTHFTGDVVESYFSESDAINKKAGIKWGYETTQYILLNKNADANALEENFKSIYKEYNFEKGVSIHLQPVTDIHLRSHYEGELSSNSDIKYIYIFSSIALLILFIACINYINLTTARSLHRAREIGLRKVLGAMKAQLVVQFLTESFLFFLCSTLLAVMITSVLWPLFSAKITAYQHVLPLFDVKLTGAVFLIFVFGGLLSGAYPAFFLSSLQPVKVLKGLSKFGINVSLRKALVVLQFAISGVLIISTILIYQQLNYVNNAPLGFNKDNLITIPYFVRGNNAGAFKNELLKNSNIQSASVASWQMGTHYGASSTMNDPKDTTKELHFQFIDADIGFIKTMGIQLESGRSFSVTYANDVMNMDSLRKKHPEIKDYFNALAEQSIMVNEEAVKTLNLTHPQDTVLHAAVVQGTVIGVVKNFNGLTLHQKIGAVILRCRPNTRIGQMYIRISPRNTQSTIDYIKNEWKKFYPDNSFDFAFTDDKLQQLYAADRRFGELFGIFATLAISIACFGLFGLISLTVQNRVKEIGIRKVLGASILDITNLISVDFIKLVLVSFIISSPIAWYFMNKWLQNFAYRINIQWWVFALACGLAIFITFVTLSFQSVKAAMANPVKSLRNE